MRTLLFGIILALGAGSYGQAVDARSVGASLVVNELTVATLKTPRGSKSPAARAQEAAATVSDSAAGAEVTAEASGPDWGINLGSRRVITVTLAEARAQGATPQAVAEKWARDLREALALPPLKAGSSSLSMPPDKTASLTLVGSRARKAVISQNPAGLVSITRFQGTLFLKPNRLGQGVVTVTSGQEKVEVRVGVLPYALRLPASAQAEVLGEPATAADVISAVRGALNRLPVVQGGRLTVRQLPEQSVPSGEQRTVRVLVRAEGPDSFPAEGEVRVLVRNSGLMPRNESSLWYSNVPENVGSPQRLYWGALAPGQTIRLLAHHKNVGRPDLDFVYYLANPGQSPASIGITMGDARPDLNPTLAGYVAGDVFLRSWKHRSGERIVIPPRTALPIVVRRVKAEETMSSLAVIASKSASNPNLILVSESLAAGRLPEGWREGGSFPNPWTKLEPLALDGPLFSLEGEPKQVYSPPIKEESFTHEAGRFTFLRVGENAILPTEGNSYSELLGNFGVHYRISGSIRNTTGAPQPVEAVFEASAGYSGAIFLVNGSYIPARLLQAKQTVRLWTKVLPPGATERLVIQTIPLSGAHYPATIIIRPVDTIK